MCIRDSSVDYTLSIQKEAQNSRLQLREGKPLILSFPKINETSKVIFQPSTIFNGITLTASSKSGDFVILVKAYRRSSFGDVNQTQDIAFPSSNKDSDYYSCLLYTSPSPRDRQKSRMPSSA
eukprot:TRINITY_DN983_c0_g1_i1.p2 TRINITY_DN983_c0_g1~~TRINITY_DN983_c0_g1_i1.p2  ORF type:complete len:122 (+),score=28.43 TRINITY_DN983_c0_g1_i1:65-430(+)